MVAGNSREVWLTAGSLILYTVIAGTASTREGAMRRFWAFLISAVVGGCAGYSALFLFFGSTLWDLRARLMAGCFFGAMADGVASFLVLAGLARWWLKELGSARLLASGSANGAIVLFFSGTLSYAPVEYLPLRVLSWITLSLPAFGALVWPSLVQRYRSAK